MSAPETARDAIAEELCHRDEGWMVADYLPDADRILDALTEAGFRVTRRGLKPCLQDPRRLGPPPPRSHERLTDD